MPRWNPDDLLNRPGIRSVSGPGGSSIHPETGGRPSATPEHDKPRGKYNNKPKVVDGVRFDSTGEATRWQVLRQMEKDSVISALRRQVVFYLLTPDGELIERYKADFVYLMGGKKIIEDWKGGKATQTPDFLRKKKWMMSVYGHDIIVTTKESSS